ncbi:MAG TPA: hypothetical protein VM032_12055 [Vicinamibacterales bacterium]|nr:hypothetical protein [Vicinamibacterales bacterium]
MLRLVKRFVALALTLVVMSANAAVCAGWISSPEARMACCSGSDVCPMHQPDAGGTGVDRVITITQAQADTCCAMSERGQSSQSGPSAVAAISSAVLGSAAVMPAHVPALVLHAGARPDAPARAGPTPRHVLLSVFLV